MDSQETCFEDLENETSLESSMIRTVNESQDFKLVDNSDEESVTQSQQGLGLPKPKEESFVLSTVNAETQESLNTAKPTTLDDKTCPDSLKDKDVGRENVSTTESTNVDAQENTVGTICDSRDKGKHSEEDDEIIQCTPPKLCSPSKKQVVSNVDVTRLKRKAESGDEPPSKILRTNSMEDAFSSEKKRLEEEKCGLVNDDDTQQEFPKNCSNTNVVIAETQETIDNELVESIIEKTEKDEEQTNNGKHEKLELAQTQQNENENFVEKDYEIDKNENLNDTSKLSQVVTEKDRMEKICDKNNIVSEANAGSTLVESKETDTVTTKSTVDDRIRLEPGNNKEDESVESKKDSNLKTKEAAIVHTDNRTADKKNGIEPTKDTDSDLKSKSSEILPNEVTKECHSNTKSSRMSIEVIYDCTNAKNETKFKSKELVEIDEDGEKIILDSSQEDSDLKADSNSILDNTKAETTYKSCYESKSSSEFSYKSVDNTKESSLESARSDGRLVNGSSESKRCDTDSTVSVQSDIFTDIPVLERTDTNPPMPVHNVNKQIKTIAPISKDMDNADLLSVSENEPDVSIAEGNKSKSDSTHGSSLTKALQVEKEVGIYIKMKCLLNVDEGTKEFLSKEVTAVHCESIAEPPSTRLKTNDTSASLADISGNDNKDSSPGSVNSNPQLFQLNPSRLSFASTISSLSSASSAASLAAKLAVRDSHFSLPRGPAKHAKKHSHETPSFTDKQAIDEAYERLTKEWHNSRLLTTTILNFANSELNALDTYNVSNERIDDQVQKIRSSTPEVHQELAQQATPKSTKKGKAVKRPRSKSTKQDAQSNGLHKISPKVLIPPENNSTPNRKKNKIEPVGASPSIVNVLSEPVGQQIGDELIGREVFAKWSDNNYYPGTVIDKVKAKYKVNFYDGKNKLLIEDFVIPIPRTLKEGLSVYATTKTDDYGSCGIISDVQNIDNEVHYIVETDEGERLRVQVKDIFLSADQAQILKEEVNSENKSLPSTPKHLGQVTLDNMVDGKRRSRRIGTPIFSTPKLKLGLQTPPSKSTPEPSVSGMSSKLKKERRAPSESEGISSDSNFSIKEEMVLSGVQTEIVGTPNEQIVKGPQSRVKSKSRSKKKAEDEETIATLGPIPHTDSTLFKGMSFILTCASLENIDRYQSDSKDCSSDAGTENEEEWAKKPFVRDRLRTQIIAGGGKIYTDFNQIPKEEYKNTKLITNIPNTTAKTLLCLSVGIPAYNHNWIIRSCQENKIISPAENELPAGWSLEKKSYVEMFQRPSSKPLTQVVIIIPNVESEIRFITFWRQICENAGAVVLLADKPEAMEGFVEGTVVLTNNRCPSWVIETANELQIPLLSTTWVVQCLIEGKLCQHYSHLRYKYNYIQN